LIRWRLVSVGLGAVGLAMSTYLSIVHVLSSQVPLLCPAGDLVNCEQVTTSPQAYVGPVPVAYLGVFWFLIMMALSASALAEREGLASALSLVWTTAGLLFVFYLICAELFLIGAICLWCTAVHALVIALFLLAVGATGAAESDLTTARQFPRR
jgi:uncharacterized membrane protein